MRSRGLAPLLMFAALAASAGSAQAAVYTVTNSGDSSTPTDCPADGVVAGCSLRAAILASNATTAVDDSIVIQAGVNPAPTSGATPDDATRGDYDVTDEVTISGQGASNTIIDFTNMQPNRRRVFDISGLVVSPGVTIQDLSITGGIESDATGGSGVKANGFTTLRRVRIFGNEDLLGSGEGAAILASDEVHVEDSLIDLNHGLRGAALAHTAGGGPVVIKNSTITANTSNAGGAIYQHINTPLIIDNSTISGNLVTLDGVVKGSNYLSDVSNTNTTVRNTIFSNPRDDVTDGDETNCSVDAVPSLYLETRGNLASGPEADCKFSNAATVDNNLTSTNPLLGPLDNNGGPTKTFALLPGSPAIDSGVATGCAAADQRGVARPLDGDGNGTAVCDRGAYEAPVPPPPASGGGADGGAGSSGGATGGGSGSGGGQPVNAFSIGGVTAGRDGSVTLTLALPGAGSVTGQDAAAKTSASGKAKPLITKTTKTVTGAGPLKLKLRPTSSAKKLLKKGKPVRVAVKVTFTPRGGTPASQTKSVKLRRKR